MKVLVTGADGYLGRGITTQLLDKGAEVIAVGFNKKVMDSRALCVEKDIFEVEDPFQEFNKPDYVVHLAWRDGFNHSSFSHIEDFPKHCLFISKILQSDVSKLCVMGSMHEVGYWEGAIDESTPCNPLSNYGIAKNSLRVFTMLESLKNDTPVLWMRGFYIVDADPRGSSIFSKIAQANLRKDTSFPFTSGKNKFDFLNYDEFCKLACSTICADECMGIVNICSGKPESLASRVERFIEDEGFDIQLQYGVYPDRPYDSPAIWGSTDKIKQFFE